MIVGSVVAADHERGQVGLRLRAVRRGRREVAPSARRGEHGVVDGRAPMKAERMVLNSSAKRRVSNTRVTTELKRDHGNEPCGRSSTSPAGDRTLSNSGARPAARASGPRRPPRGRHRRSIATAEHARRCSAQQRRNQGAGPGPAAGRSARASWKRLVSTAAAGPRRRRHGGNLVSSAEAALGQQVQRAGQPPITVDLHTAVPGPGARARPGVDASETLDTELPASRPVRACTDVSAREYRGRSSRPRPSTWQSISSGTAQHAGTPASGRWPAMWAKDGLEPKLAARNGRLVARCGRG